MNQRAEIALAQVRTGVPFTDAEVLVLGRHGFERRQRKNGSCVCGAFVDFRSYPDFWNPKSATPYVECGSAVPSSPQH